MKSPKRWIRKLRKTLWGKVLIAVIAVPLVAALVTGVVTLGGHIIKWLWNATVTEIFETNPITFWQAVMLLVLCKVLFGSHTNINQTKGDDKPAARTKSCRREDPLQPEYANL